MGGGSELNLAIEGFLEEVLSQRGLEGGKGVKQGKEFGIDGYKRQRRKQLMQRPRAGEHGTLRKLKAKHG